MDGLIKIPDEPLTQGPVWALKGGGMGGWDGWVLGPWYLVPSTSTWYQVLGTNYDYSPFLISPFDRVQTTLFEDLKFSRHRIG